MGIRAKGRGNGQLGKVGFRVGGHPHRAIVRDFAHTPTESKRMRISNFEFRPWYDRVIMRQLEGKAMSEGGIYIPETSKQKPLMGIVLATGEGKVNQMGRVIRKPKVKTGDKVLFANYSAEHIEIDGEELLLIREDDILGQIVEVAEV
jgi:chaperonin GroES